MELYSIQQLITRRYPNWNVFEIQITENEGVGITKRREVDLIDFSGHDEAFNTLEETLEYLDNNIS